MRGYNPRSKDEAWGKVPETHDPGKSRLGGLVEDACYGRRYLVGLPSPRSMPPLTLDNLFGLIDDYGLGKSDHLKRQVKPGAYADLLPYRGYGPGHEPYYLRAMYGRRPRDWHHGAYDFWRSYGAGYQREGCHYVPGHNAPRPAHHPDYGLRRKSYWP